MTLVALFRAICFSAMLLILPPELVAARLEVHSVPGITLRDNPLSDPAMRRLAVLVPDESDAKSPAPLIIYLPGWGGSSEDVIAQGTNSLFARAVDQLASRGFAVRLAVVDGRSRYGGSQFLNSAATGAYADYISGEILPALRARYAAQEKTRSTVIVAGHSSGGYGALMLASSHPEKFNAVVALSPDSDFEVTHKPLVQARVVRAVTLEELDAAMAPHSRARMPRDGHVQLIMGLSANYAPIAAVPGRFEWLYDQQGHWRQDVWQRWLDLDPLTLVRRRANAFAPAQRIYLDGAEHDEFGANIGARKIRDVLKDRKSPVTFHESPGGHSDHLLERLIRGVVWVLGETQLKVEG